MHATARQVHLPRKTKGCYGGWHATMSIRNKMQARPWLHCVSPSASTSAKGAATLRSCTKPVTTHAKALLRRKGPVPSACHAGERALLQEGQGEGCNARGQGEVRQALDSPQQAGGPGRQAAASPHLQHTWTSYLMALCRHSTCYMLARQCPKALVPPRATPWLVRTSR